MYKYIYIDICSVHTNTAKSISAKSLFADIFTGYVVIWPTGNMWRDGRISVGQCDLVESWDNLSLSQKKNLNYRYQIGCECRVSDDPNYLSPLSETLHETHTSCVSNFLLLVPDGLMCSLPNPVLTLIRTERAPLLRSTPVTQSRVCPPERTSACGRTGCWITA